jgi:hypothetical protein
MNTAGCLDAPDRRCLVPTRFSHQAHYERDSSPTKSRRRPTPALASLTRGLRTRLYDGRESRMGSSPHHRQIRERLGLLLPTPRDGGTAVPHFSKTPTEFRAVKGHQSREGRARAMPSRLDPIDRAGGLDGNMGAEDLGQIHSSVVFRTSSEYRRPCHDGTRDWSSLVGRRS